MKLNYITPAELTQMSRNQIGFQKYLDAQWQKTYPTPEAQANLLKEKRLDLEKKYVKAYHIFFNAAQDPDYKRDADAVLKKKQALADEAWTRLQRGETFEGVAKALSEDKMSAAEGGFLGYVPKGVFGKVFSDTLFQMVPGTVSKPVASPWGWHIIRREALTDEDLLDMLKADYMGDKASETVDAIHREAKIERPGAKAHAK
jgi:parvulin-like peptidyl-prolyl isomerase